MKKLSFLTECTAKAAIQLTLILFSFSFPASNMMNDGAFTRDSLHRKTGCWDDLSHLITLAFILCAKTAVIPHSQKAVFYLQLKS